MPDIVQSTLMKILWDAVHTHRTLPNGRECSDVASLFSALDADNSGTISARELHEALESMEVWLSKSQLEHLLGSIDTDHDGSIAFAELERWMAMGCVGGAGGEMLAVAFPSSSMRPSASNRTSTQTTVKASTLRTRSSSEDMPNIVQTTMLRILWDALEQQTELYGQKCTDLYSFFSAIDRDGSGAVSRRELQQAFETLDVWLTVQQLEYLLRTIDSDHDELIEWSEFEAWMNQRATTSAEATQMQQHISSLQEKVRRSEAKRKVMRNHVSDLTSILGSTGVSIPEPEA
jgi:Ca2+-binding EF-hand superfamily protein